MSATDFLADLPPDTDAAGDLCPAVGTYVICRRRKDGKTHAGWVAENRLGLFLHHTAEGAIVLRADQWDVVAALPPSVHSVPSPVLHSSPSETETDHA